jgi:serine/threonine protein kinase
MILNKYKIKKRLGRGSFGEVYLVEDRKGSVYALKRI